MGYKGSKHKSCCLSHEFIFLHFPDFQILFFLLFSYKHVLECFQADFIYFGFVGLLTVKTNGIYVYLLAPGPISTLSGSIYCWGARSLQAIFLKFPCPVASSYLLQMGGPTRRLGARRKGGDNIFYAFVVQQRQQWWQTSVDFQGPAQAATKHPWILASVATVTAVDFSRLSAKKRWLWFQ